MKKRLLAGIALIACSLMGVSEKATAQITGISLDSVQIYTQTNCLLPSTMIVSYTGSMTGTLLPTDSVTMYLNFGDGTDTTFKHPFTQGNWFWGNLNHIYTIAGNLQVMGTATSPNNHTDTFYSNIISLSNTCAPLAGRMFIDANSDCVYQPGEITINNSAVLIHNSGTNISYYAATNSSGQYNTGVPPGTYTITAGGVPGGVTASCPASGSVTQTVITGGSYTNNFAYNCSSTTASDVAIHAYAGNWRLGFSRPLYVSLLSNTACTNSAGTVSITLPMHLSYTGTPFGLPAPTVSGSTLTWNVSNLNAVNTWWTSVMIHTSTAATFGDTICVAAVYTPTGADANLTNNTDLVCAQVNNSFDPNDKRVAPEGTSTAGNIVNGTQLTYMVRFQNTGNDVAYTVTVKDKIDADLNLTTLRVLKTSHPMKLSFVGTEANFRFDNINLPDSASNEPASHGYILYTISPKANLPLGTTIQNTADIYFDFNDPIITNTTLNTIAQPQSVQHLASGTLQATVYPNPANGHLFVEVNNNSSFKAELYDIMGRTVKAQDGLNGNTTINVKELPTGTYFLKLTNKANEVLTTKINIQH
ncbi:MAG TPA: T9SS type A sorting domain-containing protein [Flavipsychrobacter sp.]|nr:T9SS type A sorting domain-containing protein [Flavipsychrobacter sp.]